MKPPVKFALLGVLGLVLLGGSFVTFAALSGVPLHEVAILKHFVKGPSKGPETHKAEKPSDESPTKPEVAATHAPAVEHGKPAPTVAERRALEANVGVLGAYLLPSPLSANELSDLQRSLRETSEDAKKRLARITDRERELDEWEHSLEQRKAEMAELRRLLERRELDLTLREDEVKRDEKAKNARETQSWGELAKFFNEGDPEELAKKLVLFEPQDAVRILRALDDARASALVNALPADKYQAYLEAYRAK